VHVCLVVPCFNESKRLDTEVYLSWLTENPECDLLFVNDGSTDGTLELLEGMAAASPQVRVLDLKRNRGKAEAVRLGWCQAYQRERYYWIGYWDADLATPLAELLRFLELRPEQPWMLMGSRVARMGAEIRRNPWRHYVGRIAAAAISLTLDLPTYDTQCGAKLFLAEPCASLFEYPFVSRWLFDVELIARLAARVASDQIHQRLVEVPLRQWIDQTGSKLRWSDFLRAPVDLWAIKRHYRL
jgi:dolichyl-phosphate beta-glucosyltransferase